MTPGGPTTTHPGDNESALLVNEWDDFDDGSGARGTLQAWTGYGDRYYRVVADNIAQQIIYLVEGADPIQTSVAYDPSRTSGHVVTVSPLGDWDSDEGIDVSIDQQYFESGMGAWVEVEFDATIQVVEAYGDSGQLSNWSLTGMERFATGRPTDRITQAELDITLANAAGVYTLTLSMNGFQLAQGSRTGNGTITLTAVNSSGLSGTVDVAYTADIAVGAAIVRGRWAERYDVVVGALTATVYDSGLGNRLSARVGPFTSGGVQAYSITPVSDTGINGTPATGNVTVPLPPLPPGKPTYVSGNWTNTVIQFTASTTPGATTRIYDSELDGPTDLDNIAATTSSTGTVQVTLPSLASAGTGKRRIIVESVLAGVESGVRRRLTLEYESGVVILPRPNIPYFAVKAEQPVTAGRTFQVEYMYNSAEQEGVATQVRLDIRSEAGVVTQGNLTPLGTPVGTIYRGTLTIIAPADGWFQYIVKAYTAGSTASENTEYADAIHVSNFVHAAPANVEARAVVG